jgi:predicted 3-demethylubiquinone-9 3-methyltransferase (glyoxalase superfamily)
MQKITPFLWFNTNAEEAVNFYTSVFPNSKILNMSRYPEDGSGLAGSVMVASFILNGQSFLALNGGPNFKFTEAISFVIQCEDQNEIDYYWEKLSAVPESEQCGWVKDQFGLSWQIVPKSMGELMSNPDPEKSKRTMSAMMRMKKIIIEDLKNA